MNYFIEPFRKYATFKGRLSRKGYWMFYLYYFIIFILLILFSPLEEFIYFYLLITFIPCFSATSRRFHDTGHSAWWILFSQIPILNIVAFIFLVTSGDSGDNKYGHATMLTKNENI